MDQIQQSIEFLRSHPDFVALNESAHLRIDLRYASSNNFVGHDMYGMFRTAYLHRIAAEKLNLAMQELQRQAPGYSFLILDALRPRSVQRILWQFVRGTNGERYIANPDRGSLHNFGFAVDLTVLDRNERELDMGAGYDDFRPIAQPQLEERFVASGELSKIQVEHRRLLRTCMQAAGFIQLPHEWWHYDALPKSEVIDRFTIVE